MAFVGALRVVATCTAATAAATTLYLAYQRYRNGSVLNLGGWQAFWGQHQDGRDVQQGGQRAGVGAVPEVDPVHALLGLGAALLEDAAKAGNPESDGEGVDEEEQQALLQQLGALLGEAAWPDQQDLLADQEGDGGQEPPGGEALLDLPDWLGEFLLVEEGHDVLHDNQDALCEGEAK